MRVFQRLCGVLVVLGLSGPASAQDSEWIAEIVRQAANEAERAVRVIVLEAAAQAGRSAAQEARDAERRRREEARRGPEVTETFSRTVRLGRDGAFSLENVSGNIEVNGTGGNDVRIDATKRARHPDQSEAKAILQDLTIDVSERGGNVDVRTEYPRYRNRRNWYGSVDYKVSVPREASVTLKSVSGDVRVTNVNGDLRAETVSGQVVTSNVRKIRLSKSVSGDVEITDAASDDLTVENVSGQIVMRNVKGRVLLLESVSGNVRLADVDAERVHTRSVSGDVEYSGPLSPKGRYEFRAHSGNVRVTPTGTQGFSIEATTFSGDVRSDFPLTLQGGQLNRGFAPQRLNRTVRGDFGSGGAMLTLQSFSGNIVIVKR